MSQAALSLYTGHTAHERRAPFRHRFSFPVTSLLIDLDRLDEAGRASALFSIGRFNLFSFHSRDFGPRDGSNLKVWALAQLRAAGIQVAIGRVRLLCSPRVFGYQFNPISIYLAEDGAGVLRGVIYEVHNTFGESHAYVAPAAGHAVERQSAQKSFHVSPFFDLSGRYAFELRGPGARISLVIRKHQPSGPDFVATLALTRGPATSAGFLRQFARLPFAAFQTVLAIHVEALKLWAKGARYHRKPPQPEVAATTGRLEQDRV